MTFVLIITRKGDVQDTYIGTSIQRLKDHAQVLDGAAPLRWQDFGWQHGVHSEHDEEKSYSIMQTTELQ